MSTVTDRVNLLILRYKSLPSDIKDKIEKIIEPYMNLPYSELPTIIKEQINELLLPYINEQVDNASKMINNAKLKVEESQEKLYNTLSELASTGENTMYRVLNTAKDEINKDFEYVKELLANTITILNAHSKALSMDVEEFYKKLITILIYIVIGVFATFFGVILLSLFIIVVFWNTNRILAFSIVTGLFLTAGLGSIILAIKSIKTMPLLFKKIIKELENDRDAILKLSLLN